MLITQLATRRKKKGGGKKILCTCPYKETKACSTLLLINEIIRLMEHKASWRDHSYTWMDILRQLRQFLRKPFIYIRRNSISFNHIGSSQNVKKEEMHKNKATHTSNHSNKHKHFPIHSPSSLLQMTGSVDRPANQTLPDVATDSAGLSSTLALFGEGPSSQESGTRRYRYR